MSKLKVIMDVLRHPSKLPHVLLSKYPQLIKGDKEFIEYLWKQKMDYPLNLDNPRTFNEKLQWLKLYDRKPEYTTMVDKVAVKAYVAKLIGEKYIIPTLGVWEDPEDIDFDKLPDQFVLKCNHDSGGLLICKDKAKLDVKKVKSDLGEALRQDYYMLGREWPYKHVPHKILAEQYMEDESGVELKDYKFFCFDGHPAFVQVDYGRFSDHKRNIYDLEWNLLPITLLYPSDPSHEIPCPPNLERMIDCASSLSKGIPFVRVDLYNIRGDIYFGEMTFFPGCGFEPFTPERWDIELGKNLRIGKQINR